VKATLLISCALAWWLALVSNCTASDVTPVPAQPKASAPAGSEEWFVKPAVINRPRLRGLHSQLEGSVSNLNLTWVANIGEAAIPTLLQLAADRTLPAASRNLVFIVLGNASRKAKLFDHPDRRNDAIVPVLFEGLGDEAANVRGSAAYASRYVNDARLVPGLEPLLQDKEAVQEQAVLALGNNGGAAHVVPIAKLLFATDVAVFRESCVYALASICVRRDVDVAGIFSNNAAAFGQDNLLNVRIGVGRFTEFQKLRDLVKKLNAKDAAARKKALQTLRAQTGAKIDFDPEADEAARAQAIERWRGYLLQDYWRAPRPSPSATPLEQTTAPPTSLR
jgi:HEAT repeat protein